MSLKILLVEDNRMNRELATDLLELEGHVVVSAETGAAARAILAEGFPADVMLLDILLPDCDGDVLLSELRRIGSGQVIPAVAVTAHALPQDIAKFMAAGFCTVITKPIDTRTFAKTVEQLATPNPRYQGDKNGANPNRR